MLPVDIEAAVLVRPLATKTGLGLIALFAIVALPGMAISGLAVMSLTLPAFPVTAAPAVMICPVEMPVPDAAPAIMVKFPLLVSMAPAMLIVPEASPLPP
jgi:hypothetical protein